VAERSAGIADDLVLGFDEMVVSRQFKTSKLPGTFTVETIVVKAIPSVLDLQRQGRLTGLLQAKQRPG